MNRALVTGAAGFVGRHMVPALRNAGWHVTTLDIDGDVDLECDARTFFALDTRRFDLVVHLAAVVGGRALIEGNPLAVSVDLAIDADMFAWAIRTRPERVVYFSSSAAYPVRLQNRAAEEYILSEGDIDLLNIDTPDLTYGWAKLTGEMLAGHARAAGVPVTVLRPFSGYGTDQALDYPFPSFIARALRRADPFDIWGSGDQARDWVHIDDVVATTLACIDGEVDGPLNICTGRATTFLELMRIVAEAAGYDPAPRLLPAPEGVHHRVGDPSLLHRVHRPQVTIEVGVLRALAAASQFA